MGFPATSTLVARMFGIQSVGPVYGNLQVMQDLGTAIGSYLAGLIFDTAGSYYPAFGLATAIAAIAMMARCGSMSGASPTTADRLSPLKRKRLCFTRLQG